MDTMALDQAMELARLLADNPLLIAAMPIATYAFRGVLARRQARDFVAQQLISIQRDLAELALNKNGGAKLDDHLQQQLMRQTSGRVPDLKCFTKTAGLGARAAIALDAYERAATYFANVWSESSQSGDKRRDEYDKTKAELHRCLKALNRHGLVSRGSKFELESGTRIKKPDETPGTGAGNYRVNQVGYRVGG